MDPLVQYGASRLGYGRPSVCHLNALSFLEQFLFINCMFRTVFPSSPDYECSSDVMDNIISPDTPGVWTAACCHDEFYDDHRGVGG